MVSITSQGSADSTIRPHAATVQGVSRQYSKTCYDAALGDREASAGTYREFVAASEDVIYPEYIVLYTRTYRHDAESSPEAGLAPAAAAAAALAPPASTEEESTNNRRDFAPHEPLRL